MTKLVLEISKENLEMLIELRKLLDMLIDVLEVETDEELLSRIDEGLEDVEKGRVVSLGGFLKDIESRER